MELTDDAERLFHRQDYSKADPIEGVELIPLRRFHDDGGSFTELARLDGGALKDVAGFRPAQINYSTLSPGVIKAFHLHRRQTDLWYVPPEDRFLVVLVDVRRGSASEGRRVRLVLGDGESALLRVPPGVAHGCRNLGSSTGRIIYLTDLPFSADSGETDEGRLPWDFAGADVWDVARE